MSCYVGIDISMEESSICVMDADGEIIDEGKVATDPRAIDKFLDDYVLDELEVGFETGPISGWLWHELTSLGFRAIMMDARSVHQFLKAQRNKTDRADARGIARVLRFGCYLEARAKSYENHQRRALLHARSRLVDMRQDLENSVRGLLKPLGLLVPRGQRSKFAENVRDRCEGYDELLLAVEALLQARDTVLTQIKCTDDALLKAARNDVECRRLMTIPGVGPMTAMAFTSSIDNIGDFPNARSVGAYFGLTPRRYQSGDIDYQGRICKRGDRMVRKLLYEAANVMLTISPKFSTLKAWGLAVAKRSGMRKARVAVARKLAVVMATMLRDGTDFQFSTKAGVTA